MKKITTVEAMENYLKEGFGIRYYRVSRIRNENDYGILVDSNGVETETIVKDNALIGWLSMYQRLEIHNDIKNGETPLITTFDLFEKKKEKRQKSKEKKEAIKYFKNLEEGDNITITSDFLKKLEILLEALK